MKQDEIRYDVNPDIREAKTLNTHFYLDAEAYEKSKEKIFARCWQFAGDSDQIGEPGWVTPVQLLPGMIDEPLVLTRDKEGKAHILAAEKAALDDNRVSGNGEDRSLTTVTDGICHHVFCVDNLKAAISETLDEEDLGLGAAIPREVAVVQGVGVLHRQAELTPSVGSTARHHGEDVSDLLLVQFLVRIHVSNLATPRSGVNFYFLRRRSLVDGDLEDDREPIQYRIVQPLVYGV